MPGSRSGACAGWRRRRQRDFLARTGVCARARLSARGKGEAEGARDRFGPGQECTPPGLGRGAAGWVANSGGPMWRPWWRWPLVRGDDNAQHRAQRVGVRGGQPETAARDRGARARAGLPHAAESVPPHTPTARPAARRCGPLRALTPPAPSYAVVQAAPAQGRRYPTPTVEMAAANSASGGGGAFPALTDATFKAAFKEYVCLPYPTPPFTCVSTTTGCVVYIACA